MTSHMHRLILELFRISLAQFLIMRVGFTTCRASIKASRENGEGQGKGNAVLDKRRILQTVDNCLQKEVDCLQSEERQMTFSL